MLSIRDLSKTFGRRPGERVIALDGVDLDVNDGELLTLLGPSGCGKTTLLRSVAGFEIPDTGTITIADVPVIGDGVRFMPAHQRGVGLVPQEGALFPHLSVGQNVGFGLREQRRRAQRRMISEALELVGLAGYEKRRPHELSGGQQQRVALARAIAPRPRIILLDEPFSSLDEYLRDTLRTQVRHLLKELGTTAILVTHDQEEALAMGDRVAVMRAGKLIQVDHPRQAYYQPLDLELARFLGEAVVVRGEVDTALSHDTNTPLVRCPFGVLPVASWHGQPGRCDVLIRPENITIAAIEPGPGGTASGLTGTVVDHEFYGHDGLVRIHVPQLDDSISVRVLGDQHFNLGDQVQLSVQRPVCTYADSVVSV